MTPADLALAEYVAKKGTPMLHVFANECDWVVATDLEDAWEVYAFMTGGPVERCKVDFAEDPLVLLDDDKPIEFWADDSGQLLEVGSGALMAKPASEWARLHGRGFMASTEY